MRNDNAVAEKYDRITQTLHWLMGILIIAEISLALIAEDMPEGTMLTLLKDTHKSVGVLLLSLIVVRVGWRLYSPKLAPLMTLSPLVQQLSKFGHRALYCLMILLPLSGWLMSSSGGHPVGIFDLVQLPPLSPENESLHELFEEVHVIAGNLLLIMVGIHIAAVAKHRFLGGLDIMFRMSPFHR